MRSIEQRRPRPRARWWLRRSQVRAGLLAATALVVAVATVLISVILGVVQRGTTDGVRSYLADRDDSASVLAFASSPGADRAAQDAAARAVVDGLFAGLPVELFDRTFSGRFTPTSGLPAAKAVPAIRWGTYSGAAQHATLRDGRWPAGGGERVESAIPAEVADRLGLRVGSRLGLTAESSLGDAGPARTVELEVVGVFQPDDSGFWSASRALVSGAGITDSAPVFQVAADAFAADRAGAPVAGVLAAWLLVPRIDAIVGNQVAALAAGVHALPTAIRSDARVSIGGTLFAGDLDVSLDAAAAAAARAAAAAPLPLVLVTLFCLVMLVQLGRLLTDDRRPETVLLLSRGLSAGRASWWAAVETLVVALAGAVVGTLVVSFGPGLALGGLIAAAAAVLVATVAATVPAWREAAAPLVRDRADDSGRARALVAGGVVLLVVGAAAFAWWRFRLAPSTPTGSVETAVLVAPAVLLLAGGLVATVLFGAVAVLVARVVPGRDRGVGLALPIRQIARRATVFASIVLLGSLSVGGAVLAATYSGTVAELERSADRLQVGPDVRVDGLTFTGSATSRGPLAQADALPGVRAASPVVEIAAPDGDATRTVAGLRAARLTSLLPSVAGTDPAIIASALRGADEVGNVLPTNASRIRVVGTLGGVPRSSVVTVAAWWATTDDLVVRQVVGSGTGGEVKADAPAPAAGSRLVAVDLEVARAAETFTIRGGVAVSATNSAGAQVGGMLLPATARGVLIATGAGSDAVSGPASAVAATVGPVGESAQPAVLRLAGPAVPDADTALPAVVDERAANESGLGVGDELTLSVDATPLTSKIVAVVPVLPGFDGEDAVLTDLLTLQRQLLVRSRTLPEPTGLWLGSATPIRTAGAAAASFGGGVQITAVGSSAALSAPAITAYRWGTAGSLGLAVAGVAVVAVALAHRRRSELVVLTALGIRPARQAALRRRELAVTVVLGWVLGGVLGALTVAAVVPRLAVRSVVGGQQVPDPGLVIEGGPLAIQLAAHAAGVLVVVLVGAWQVRRGAAAGDPRWVTP